MADSQETEQTPTAGEENVETPKTETSTPAPTTEEPQPDEQPKADEAESKDEESKTEEPPSEQPEDKAESKSEEASIDQVAAESKSEVAGSEQAEVPPEPSAEAEKPAEGEETTKEVTETDVEGGTEPTEGEKVEGEKVEGEEKEKPEGEEEEKTEGEEVAEGAEKEKVGEEEEKTEGEAVTTVGESEEDVAVAESVITPGKEDEEEGQEEERDQSPLPKSDTFEEGERPASPERIGEKLSREPTPEREPPAEPVTDIKPDSPFDEEGKHVHDTVYEEGEELEMEEEEEEAEEEVVPTFDREALIEKYHSILSEREVLQNHNLQLQTKLSDYFRKKKADERQDYDKNVTDQEQRYLKYMAQLEDLRRQDMQQRELYQNQIEDHKARCEEKRDRVDEERQKFMEFKKQIALSAINTRSGKPIAPKDTEQYLSNENKKELEVVNVRLENIKLKNKLKKKEQQLKSKEELAEGLHLIDFEQLKIENQTYNEKIEERNEELLKLRKKITSTVQVLTHLKEKLQFVQAENHVQRGNLREVEALAAQKRDILSRTKQARDSLRIDNQRLRQNCGLLGNEPLLRDFEERVDESEELRDKLERMKMIHAEMTLTCNQVRRKIEQARSGRT